MNPHWWIHAVGIVAVGVLTWKWLTAAEQVERQQRAMQMIVEQLREMESVVKHHTCDYHKRNPGKPYAGCTCSTSYGQRPTGRILLPPKECPHCHGSGCLPSEVVGEVV